MKFGHAFWLLFVLNFICEISSYTLEQVIRESLERGLKSLTQLKRQLPDDLDEESGELLNGDKDYTTRDEVPVPLPTPGRRAIADNGKAENKIKNHNCSCNFKKHSQTPPQYLVTLNENGEDEKGSDITINEPTAAISFHPTPSSSVSITKAQLNETHFELHELELQLEAAMREVCPRFKDIPDLDIDSMADVWQLAYYKSEDVLTCFKIFLKKTSPQIRKRNRSKYTSFNDTIDWHECYLELGSTGKRVDNRRHFLQGSKSDKGVLENIVLSQSTDNDNNVITLHDQTPDQWLVTNNLLLMRDCDTGDVVIFTRIPTKPDKREMVNAMNKFGENGMNGTKPCTTHKDNDKGKRDDLNNLKYNTLS